jgi:hypothetical protein
MAKGNVGEDIEEFKRDVLSYFGIKSYLLSSLTTTGE